MESLIDPADKQNVPKAVTLIQSIYQLKSLDTSSYSPSQINEHRSLVTVGEIFSSFLDAFTTVTMALSDQLISLSKYAHAAFAVYSKHSTNFMTSPLYADSQAIVKDVYFCVAKQKLLNPRANFYIMHCGTDRLETDFCLARTQNHHRNFDILDLAGKLATSSLIDSIFARNPTLDAGSRRLKVTGVIGVDHLNPKSWIGDVDVSKVSLQLCWEEGRRQASLLVASLYPRDPVVDFSAVFCLTDHDLLRPRGRYVGFSNEADISIDYDRPNTPAPHPDDPQPTTRATDHLADDSDEDDGHDDNGSDGGGRDLEDLLPDSADEPLNGSNHTVEDWLEIDGQRYSKACLVSQHLRANCSKKLAERALRVRGLTLDGLRKRPPEFPLDPGGDNLQIGDITATLVRTESVVCLTILQVTGFRRGRHTQHIIKAETLHDPKEDYYLEGEALQIIQAGPEMWEWPLGSYLEVSKPKKSGSEISGIRDFALSVPGFLCYRANPEVHSICPNQLSPSPPLDPSLLDKHESWTFRASELLDLLQLMWANFRPENDQNLVEKIELLPQVWSSKGFPYNDNSGTQPTSRRHWIQALMTSSGTPAFVVEDFVLSTPNVDPDKEIKQQCPLCNEPKKLKEMRGHVGRHILLHLHGIEDVRRVTKVSLPRLSLIPNLNLYIRSVTILVDSAAVTSAAPASWLPVPNGRLNRTVGFNARSSMAQPRSQRKILRAPTSQLRVHTVQRRSGNTTPSAMSHSDTTPFSMVPALTPILSSRSNLVKRRR